MSISALSGLDAGVGGGKLLQTSLSPAPRHHPFSSSEWSVRVFSPVVFVAAG
jgi:hypothetical protein